MKTEQKPGRRLIQVSDSHLFADPQGELVGMNCEAGLQDVLALIARHETDPATLVYTGDASQDHSLASYQRLAQGLESLPFPYYWIRGNHDEQQQMQKAIGADHAAFTRSFKVENWRVILLNSAVDGKIHGRLAAEELNWLQQSLAECQEACILLCLHHNPVPVAAKWLQQHALQNPQDLFAALDADQRIKAVIFGHIHHELRVERNGVIFLGSPSTCIQFHPTAPDFTVDTLNPGYRWLDLQADGTINTGIRRVSGKNYNIDFSGVGY